MSSRKLCALVLVVAVTLALSSLATGFVTTELVVSGLNRPVYLTAPPGDDRLFILEQPGMIQLYKDGSLLPQPFLDITALVSNAASFSEQGLLGLAFDPSFDTNDFFYVHYSDTLGNTVIARYEVDSGNPDLADPGSAEIVLTQTQPFANHNGGTIEFGPDGYLYFGFGDGGSGGDPGNRAQDPTTLLGKFIRIDVDPLPYTVPPSNPYAGSGTVENEIWAFGLRNPYRWSFDRDTGDLWIADVGQSEWEEVDFQPAASTGGENYGWRLMEGMHCFNPPSDCGSDTLDLPIHEYGHDEGCSITGGYVYRGAAIPQLQGYYIFGDYCSVKIWALRYDGSSVTDFVDLTDLLNGDDSIGDLSGICEDGEGEMYLIDLDGSSAGEVYRIISDPTGVDGDEQGLGPLRLAPPSPNPFGNGTSLTLFLTGAGHANIRIFDVKGRVVRTVLSRPLEAGEHPVSWDGRNESGATMPSGVYFIRAEAGGETVEDKISLIR